MREEKKDEYMNDEGEGKSTLTSLRPEANRYACLRKAFNTRPYCWDQ